MNNFSGNIDMGPSKLIALIGDEDACVGFLLGGIGEKNRARDPELNYMVVDGSTTIADIEDRFRAFLRRDDINIILIQQSIADLIRPAIEAHRKAMPAILEIPSKSAPYDPKKDSIMKRAQGLIEPHERT